MRLDNNTEIDDTSVFAGVSFFQLYLFTFTNLRNVKGGGKKVGLEKLKIFSYTDKG